jgi:hypothetical protein
MTTLTDQNSNTPVCRGCGKPTHLWDDPSGESGWSHDRIVDEYRCFTDNRAAYEAGDL